MKCIWRQEPDKQIMNSNINYNFSGHPVCNISVTSCLYVTVSSAIVSNDYNVTSVALDTIDNTSDSEQAWLSSKYNPLINSIIAAFSL